MQHLEDKDTEREANTLQQTCIAVGKLGGLGMTALFLDESRNRWQATKGTESDVHRYLDFIGVKYRVRDRSFLLMVEEMEICF